ncbi:MAG: hypothetical protein GC146_07070 [Limimaricola sp.]|nr:hypothetical protein [Limimaricola sp.]
MVWAGAAGAAVCGRMQFEGANYTVCAARPAQDDLRLFLDDANGQPYGSFSAVRTALEAEGKHLVFAMNGGMYRPDLSPVGYYVEDGVERTPLLTGASKGNFGMLPNGVFCIGSDTAQVIETRLFARTRPACRYATQSGPMLVIGGKLHPRLIAGSPSRLVRNGVGTTAAGDRAVFVIADKPVNLYDFARAFRDALGLSDALYLDGRVSRLYAPAIGRDDIGLPMGPIVGLVE